MFQSLFKKTYKNKKDMNGETRTATTTLLLSAILSTEIEMEQLKRK